MDINMKDMIDRELERMVLSEEMKNRIRERAVPRRRKGRLKWAAVLAAAVILGGTGTAAGYRMLITHSVNGEVLPALDSMRVVQIHFPTGNPQLRAPAEQEVSARQDRRLWTQDEYGMFHKDFHNYGEIQEELGIHLLDTELSENNPCMLGNIMTDGKDFAVITVENYILGDTGRYQFLEEENRYSYESGSVFLSPISLTVRLVLSEEQLHQGWDWEYLGMYRFVESYTSAQGYTVNLVARTLENGGPGGGVSEKNAVFAADGIEYSLRGRVSMETMKLIVDMMK